MNPMAAMRDGRQACVMMILGLLFFVSTVDGMPQTHRRRLQKTKTVQSAQVQPVRANYGSFAFSMRSIDGVKIDLSTYGGRVVLVTIWSATCEPCKKEAAGLVRLYAAYHLRGFEIIGVAVQSNETDVRSFIQENSVPWVSGINDSITAAYGMYGLPDHFLFNVDGTLIKHFVGYTREDALKPYIEQALKNVIHRKNPKAK